MPNLLTLDELKSALNIDPSDTRKDVSYGSLIPWASQAVIDYAGRDFGSPVVMETRNFEYDGSGFLDIDDATDITGIEFVIPSAPNLTLDSDSWYAAPARRADSPVYYYVVIGSGSYGTSPEMGFTRNLDVLWQEGRYPTVSRTAAVTGTWGWPDVPGPAKLATIWTIQDWTSKPSGEGLTAEAIEGYSRSWGSRTGPSSPSLAIPNRARDLLSQYQKVLT